jgi:hypothetical protein
MKTALIEGIKNIAFGLAVVLAIIVPIAIAPLGVLFTLMLGMCLATCWLVGFLLRELWPK